MVAQARVNKEGWDGEFSIHMSLSKGDEKKTHSLFFGLYAGKIMNFVYEQG